MGWDEVHEKVLPYVVSLATPEGSGTGFLFAYNDLKTIAAIATAAHVVEHAHDWKLPLKVRHHLSQEELFVLDAERLIDLDRRRDSASVLIPNRGLPWPDAILPMMDPTKFKRIGSEVGWVGFPAIAVPYLCFFTGRISGFITEHDSYLIDGVAINGVSGGPVFVELTDGTPQIIGTVSAYMPNRIRGDALPGLLRAQDVTSFQATVKTIKSLDEARRRQQEEEERRRQQEQLPRPQPQDPGGSAKEPGT